MAGRGGAWSAAWLRGATVLFAVVGIASGGVAIADGDPEFELVAVMHQNLAAINEIDEALVRDDYSRIKKAAEILEINAAAMKGIDFDLLRLKPEKTKTFDRHLAAQRQAAVAIEGAADREDAEAVLQGVKLMLDDSCVACHSEFRETDESRTPRVLFMRSLLSSVQSVNRGIALDDYALIAREAREIAALAHILTWNQVIESMFMVKDPAARAEFRGYFETLSSQAIRVEHAATERNPKMVSAATREMLAEGCVRCHRSFREDIRERVKKR